jgi:polysaccharide deacetylase 2 family uncharacterized protein YibQ
MWPLIAACVVVVVVLWWLGCGPRRPSAGIAPQPGSASGARSGSDLASRPPSGADATPTHARRRQASDDSGPGAPAGSESTGDEATSPAPHGGSAQAPGWQPRRPLLPSGEGQIAIIVDDVGYDDDALEDFLAVGYPLTFSVLPQLDDSGRLARACSAAGFEVMLHLPMQPLNSRLNPGPGCITVDMDDREIDDLVEKNLDTVPGAVGANNHMGSRACADRRVMTAALSALRRHGLFFVNSMTIGSEVPADVASALGVPYAERSVFLDTNFSPEPATTQDFLEAAQGRMEQLARAAQRHGAAIGICHYHPRTADMLKALLPAVKESGVKIVPVSQIVAGSEAGLRAPASGGSGRSLRPYEPARDR